VQQVLVALPARWCTLSVHVGITGMLDLIIMYMLLCPADYLLVGDLVL